MKLTLPTILILTVLTQPLFGQNALGDFHAPKLIREALINTMIEQPDGKILIGGDVNYFNDAPIGSIVRVQANGELDNTFSFTFDEEGCYAADMALRTSGDVFVLMRQLNRFSTVQRDKSWIVKLGANGSVVQKISTLPYARTMAMQGDGKIVVGAGQPRPLARYNADLSEDNAFNTAVTLDGWIDDIEISGNKIYLLGGFQHVNGVAKATVVRLDADGSVDTAFDLGGSKITQAQDFTVLPDGKLIFGGFARYTFPDATIKAPLFRINADGSLDDTFQLPPLEPFNSYFYGPVVASAVGYYVQFRVPAGDANIIRIKSDATVDKTFNPVPLDNRSEYDPYMIASATGLIVANVQTSISKYNIFRTSSTGDLVEAFAPPIARVGAIHHSDYANGKILIGGDFIKIDGHDTYRVARLNPDGTVDNTFTVPEHHGIAAQVKILGDNNVLIKTERGFFKFDAQGDTYPGFSWTSGAGNLYYVEKFKVLPNGMIMAVDANTLARLHADGSVDESFSIHRMGDMGSTAVAFDMQGDNAIYGTLFDGVQGMPANNLARITPQGEADPTFNVGGGPQFVVENPSQAPWPSINMIKVLDNGEVLAGGIFNRFDGKVIAHSLVKLSRDGTLIEAFNTNHSAQDLWGECCPTMHKSNRQEPNSTSLPRRCYTPWLPTGRSIPTLPLPSPWILPQASSLFPMPKSLPVYPSSPPDYSSCPTAPAYP
jgi:uncharacterized delta-60 repeat protein